MCLLIVFNQSIISGLNDPIVYPNKYSHDAYDFYTSIKNYVQGNSIYYNDDRAYPTGADYRQFPQLENINLFLIKAIYYFSSNLFQTINLYILLGFVLSANSMYFLLTSALKDDKKNTI